MFSKLLGKSKKNQFQIPQKNFQYDSKTVSKLSSKDLILLSTDQDKYISVLLKKFDSIRDDFNKQVDKIQELSEKNLVINQQTGRMSNEHEQLTIKFNNLQNALELTLRQRETSAKGKDKGSGNDSSILAAIEEEIKIISLPVSDKMTIEQRFKGLLDHYKNEASLACMVEKQNVQLKSRIEQLESEYFSLQEAQSINKETLLSMRHQLSTKDSQLVCLKQAQSATQAHSEVVSQLQEELARAQQQQKLLVASQALLKESLLRLESQLAIKLKQVELREGQIQNLRRFIQEARPEEQPPSVQNFELIRLQERLQQRQFEWETDKARLKSEIQHQQLSLQKQHLQIADIRQKYQWLTQDSQNSLALKAQNQTLSNQNANLKLTLEHLRSAQISTEVQHHKAQLLSKEVQQLKSTISNLQRQLAAKIAECRKESLRQIQDKDKEIALLKLANADSETKFGSARAQFVSNLSQSERLLSRRVEEVEEMSRKARKMESEQNTNNIKMDSLRKANEKLNDKIKENKESMEKIYQENLNQISKNSQLQDKVKEYKKEIQKQKSERVDLEEAYRERIRLLEGQLTDRSHQIQTTKMQSSAQHQAKQTQLVRRINRLQQDTQDYLKEIETLHKEISALRQVNSRSQEGIKELSERRQQAILQIQRLEKLLGQKGPTEPGKKGLAALSVEDPQKQDRSKKTADKAFRAFSIILKLLQGMYKEFVRDYISEIKEQRVQKLQNGINQLITKATDMKDVFKDYM